MGRERKYDSAAEKMKAYRARVTERLATTIAELKTRAETPVIVEKVVERVVEVEKIVKVPSSAAARTSKTSKTKHPKVWSVKREEVILSRFATEYSSPENAKRFQMNTTRAITAIREIKEAIERGSYEQRQALAADIEMMDHAAYMLASYANAFERAKKESARKKDVREITREKETEVNIKATLLELFGESPDPEAIKSMAFDFIEFTRNADTWGKQKYSVAKAFVPYFSYIDLEFSTVALARKIAEVKLEIPTRGSRFEYQGEIEWQCGWNDFVEWRANKGGAK